MRLAHVISILAAWQTSVETVIHMFCSHDMASSFSLGLSLPVPALNYCPKAIPDGEHANARLNPESCDVAQYPNTV